MKVVGERRKLVQNVVSEAFSEALRLNWKWEKGEKDRVIKAFIVLADTLEFTEDHHFDKALLLWKLHVIKAARSWTEWDLMARHNYIGYICKITRIKAFCANYKAKNQATSTNVAGTKTNDKWDF